MNRLSELMPYLHRAADRRLKPLTRSRVDPADLVQETLLEAFRRMPDYFERDNTDLQNWLLKLLHQKHVDLMRYHVRAQCRSVLRERRLATADVDSLWFCLRRGKNRTDTFEIGERKGASISRSLRKLPPDDQKVLILRCIERLKFSQIAILLGVSQPAASKRYQRALNRLRRDLEGSRSNQE